MLEKLPFLEKLQRSRNGSTERSKNRCEKIKPLISKLTLVFSLLIASTVHAENIEEQTVSLQKWKELASLINDVSDLRVIEKYLPLIPEEAKVSITWIPKEEVLKEIAPGTFIGIPEGESITGFVGPDALKVGMGRFGNGCAVATDDLKVIGLTTAHHVIKALGIPNRKGSDTVFLHKQFKIEGNAYISQTGAVLLQNVFTKGISMTLLRRESKKYPGKYPIVELQGAVAMVPNYNRFLRNSRNAQMTDYTYISQDVWIMRVPSSFHEVVPTLSGSCLYDVTGKFLGNLLGAHSIKYEKDGKIYQVHIAFFSHQSATRKLMRNQVRKSEK